MKGNQGLEALAALCGGAAKVRTSDESTPSFPPSAAAPLVQGANSSSSSSSMSAGLGVTTDALFGATHYLGQLTQAPTGEGLVQNSAGSVGETGRIDASQLNGTLFSNLTQQQWQQVITAAAASAYGGGSLQAGSGAAALLSASSRNEPAGQLQGNETDTSNTNPFLQRYIQAQIAHMSQLQSGENQRTAQMTAPFSLNAFADPNTAIALALAASQVSRLQQQQQQQEQEHHRHLAAEDSPRSSPHLAGLHEPLQHQGHQNTQTVQRTFPGSSCSNLISSMNSGITNSMQPPSLQPRASHVSSTTSIAGSSSSLSSSTSHNSSKPDSSCPMVPSTPKRATQLGKIIPPKPSQQPLLQRPASDTPSDKGVPDSSQVEHTLEEKKALKRIANRRSAQLSRKRKKMFIEELKEENDELRRKEQILRSVPDLIVVFDSAGKLLFVSHSVSRMLDYTPTELEGSSFWERLCDESVRLLKAAFMDALAARQKQTDMAPLGTGVWELRLVDRDGSQRIVTLNGVVHFSGEVPECVCSIRPRDALENRLKPQPTQNSKELVDSQRTVSTSSTTDKSVTAASIPMSPASDHYRPLIRSAIKPQQSVVSNGSSDDGAFRNGRPAASASVCSVGASVGARRSGFRSAAHVSDGESIASESGSER